MKQKSTGSKRTRSAGANGKSKSGSTDRARRRFPYLAICVANPGNEMSLQLGKAYKVIKGFTNDPAGRIRVVDEEGEDYLYPADWFVPIELDRTDHRRVMEAVAG